MEKKNERKEAKDEKEVHAEESPRDVGEFFEEEADEEIEEITDKEFEEETNKEIKEIIDKEFEEEEKLPEMVEDYLKNHLPLKDIALQGDDDSGNLDDFYRELLRTMRHLPGVMGKGRSFPDMKEDIEQMREYLDDFIKQAIRDRSGDGSGEPIVYGFSMKMGPDGKPRFRTMDNRTAKTIDSRTARVKIRRSPGPGRRGAGNPVQGKVSEPFTEVMDNEYTVSLTMEIPGVAKEDINIEMDENEMSVKVDTFARQYRKKLTFPSRVKPETAKATFNNGVMDIVIEKQTPSRNGKQRISIE